MSNQTVQSPAVVKKVISGDILILRGKPKGCYPPERRFYLSHVAAPKLAVRSIGATGDDVKDKPFAWEAREFLRKKLVGQEVHFTVDVEESDLSKPTRGTVTIGKDGENIAMSLIEEGLADVRPINANSNEFHKKLGELEKIAKAGNKGKHGPPVPLRELGAIDDLHGFVESLERKPVKGIIEHFYDGSTFEMLLLPDKFPYFYTVHVMLSGIQCDSVKSRDDNRSSEDTGARDDDFGRETLFFSEFRLLQKDVEIILERERETGWKTPTFFGTIVHPGNISELLLREGFAKCDDRSIQYVTTGIEKLRHAEKVAKEKRSKRWKNWAPSGPAIEANEQEFYGKVVEIINGDAMTLKLSDGSTKKIHLSSVRPPKHPDMDPRKDKIQSRPLYDIPFMFEAREFLRKKLIGKKVHVKTDYKQPANENFPGKICCTVRIGGDNVAEALLSKGLGTVIRYRGDDNHRSAHYDELLAAESKAQKSLKGVHCVTTTPTHRVVNLSGDIQKSKQFFPFLERAGRMEAIVEFVSSGSRFRLFVPRENVLLTFLLAGISCARPSRSTDKTFQIGDPYGNEALVYTKDLCLQREVIIRSESLDKAGNVIGWLWLENVNMSEVLVREGFAEVYSTGRSLYSRELTVAQETAKEKKLRIWKDYDAKVEQNTEEDVHERKCLYMKVMVTEIRSNLDFCAQLVDEGPRLEEMLSKLRQDFSSNPPLAGSYIPKKGEICAARFSGDDLWYRAKVNKIKGDDVHVTYIDYGNEEDTTSVYLATLPSVYQQYPKTLHEYKLAFVKHATDPEYVNEARAEFLDLTDGKVLLLNVEYHAGTMACASLMTADDETDIAQGLIEKGLAFVEKRKENRFKTIMANLMHSQDIAKRNRLNHWEYGDITEDDAKEFG